MTYDNEWAYSGLGIPDSDDNENLDLTTENEEEDKKNEQQLYRIQ